jgi:DNA polymerase-3 subunit alpha
MFSEVLVASRPQLEAGKSILLTVVADWVDDELKLRALQVADLDKAAADAGEGLRIYLEDTRPLNAIAGQLRQTGKGLVTLVVPGSGGQEVEIKLRDRQQVTAAIRNAIKSLPGVAAVETL